MKRLLQAIIMAGSLAVVGCQDATRPDATGPQFSRGQGQVVPDRYIVLFSNQVADPGSVARGLAQAHGLTVRHVYGTAVKGFVGRIPPARLDAVRSDPRVVLVEQERDFQIDVQVLPTGIDRIEADRVSSGTGFTVGGVVGMLDTGIDQDHPDLNVAGGMNFAGGPSGKYNDGNGHGTHTAGTVGAIDNGSGVVGVAPGVGLWGIKVCKNGGICSTGDIVAGIDWMAARKLEANNGNSNGINFAVANMSIGTTDDESACNGSSGAVHRAICGLVNEGVVFVLAAGNNGRLKKAYPEAMTVSAIADFDGKGGGLGSPTCRNDIDETLANFSNYGPTIDIAAPGVCILSTWNDGGTRTISGTSMAAPHVAGAVALYLHVNGRLPAYNDLGVDTIEAAIIVAALPVGATCSYTNEKGSIEPLLFVNGPAFGGDGICDLAAPPTPITDIAVTAVSAPTSVIQGDEVNVGVTVENVGNQDVGTDIAVTLTDNGADLGIGLTISGGLLAGRSATVTFSWNTTDLTLGTHSLEGSHNFTDADADNNSTATSVEVVSEPPAGTGPSVTACSPDSASPNTRPLVAVTGSNFQDGATVDFGQGIAVQNVTVVSSEQLDVQIKVHRRASSDHRDVTVTNPDGQSGTGTGCFTVN